jgi:Flp pilus assembly protein TadG
VKLKDGSMITSRSRETIDHRFKRRHVPLGQATVEFALVSIIFFSIVLGTIDFGRAIYMYSQLTNSVREGARYAEVSPSSTTAIKQRVVSYSSGLDLSTGDVTVSCSTTCKTGNNVTVSAEIEFSLVAQSFLGIAPFHMHAHATNAID